MVFGWGRCVGRGVRSRAAKNDSATALSYGSPRHPTAMAMLAWWQRFPNALEVYWLRRSDWWISRSGRRWMKAMSRASVTSGVVNSLRMDQPTSRRDQT